jgi:hypothetical protein
MNFTNDSGENDNDKNTSSDEDEDNENLEKFFSDNNNNNNEVLDSSDDDDDNESDIENHYSPKNQFSKQNHLCTILRQSNNLIELKLNIFHNHSSLRHVISDNDMSKENDQQRNSIYFSSTRLRRLYLPSSCLYELQTQITNWLQASTCLIDSISTSTYHRQCWSQLLLTYFIEQRFVNLQFILCTHSLSLPTVDQNSCSIHQYACIPEEDAYKLCSILQKGSRFNIDSNIFDHIRRIIVIKSMQEGKKNKKRNKRIFFCFVWDF